MASECQVYDVLTLTQSFQVAPKYKVALAYITGWVWLIGNWTITLSGAYCRYGGQECRLTEAVNFGFASLLSATIRYNLLHATAAVDG